MDGVFLEAILEYVLKNEQEFPENKFAGYVRPDGEFAMSCGLYDVPTVLREELLDDEDDDEEFVDVNDYKE